MSSSGPETLHRARRRLRRLECRGALFPSPRSPLMSLPEPWNATTSEGARQRPDALRRRFEQAWRDGPRPRLEDYLAAAGDLDRAVLLAELLAVEVRCRRAAAETPSTAEYADRFPDLTTLIEAVVAPPPS